MKLIIMRHGRTQPDAPDGDHERRLVPLGVEQTEAVGTALLDAELVPNVAIVSSAVRAKETWEALPAPLTEKATARLEKALYRAQPHDLRAMLDDAQAGTLLVIAHNPTLAQFIIEACPDQFDGRLSPGDTVVIERNGNEERIIASVSAADGRLEWR